jgi:hypothetical protein
VRASFLLLLAILPAGAQAQQLGTLFHSPSERDALDRQRRGDPVIQAPADLPDPVVTGYVKRSDGKSTVFLDGKPYRARDARTQQMLDPRMVDKPAVAPGPQERPAKEQGS